MKIYLITGASSDIGLAYIEHLEKRQEECIVLGQYYQNGESLKVRAEEYHYVKLELYRCDLTASEAVQGWIEKICEDSYEPSHILHLAASKFDYMRLKDFDWEKTKQEIEIQVHSISMILKTFLPKMAMNRYGKVVFMLTAYTIGVPPKYMSDYIITKYALLGLMKSVASEYSGKGININGISPNMIETKFISKMDSRAVELNAMNSAMLRNVLIDEVVAGIEYLMSDMAVYVNGINLNMTGGDRM